MLRVGVSRGSKAILRGAKPNISLLASTPTSTASSFPSSFSSSFSYAPPASSPFPPSSSSSKPRDKAVFYVNGERVEIRGPDLEASNWSLLDHLRLSRGLSGTKRVCDEGGCGACTVLVSDWDPVSRSVRHRTAASCLLPVAFADNSLVTTCEGAGSLPGGAAVQREVVECHASQCGYCTPGVVMALLGSVMRGRCDEGQLAGALDGTLCRCTGYRPMLQACQGLAREAPRLQMPHTDDPLFLPRELRGKLSGTSLCLVSEDTGASWHRPATLDELLDLLRPTGTGKGVPTAGHHSYPFEGASVPALQRGGAVSVISGSTDYSVAHGKSEGGVHLVSMVAVDELREVSETEEGTWLGAAVTIDELRTRMLARAEESPADEVASETARQLSHFANQQVRNFGTIGGSLCNASHMSDLVPILCAVGAQVEIVSASDREGRTVPASEFVQGDRRVALRAGEIVRRVLLPRCKPGQRVMTFKVGIRRQQDCQAFLNGCISLDVDARSGTIRSASVRFGGVGVAGARAVETERALVGLPIDDPAALDNLIEQTVIREARLLVKHSRHPTEQAKRYQRRLVEWAVRTAVARITDQTLSSELSPAYESYNSTQVVAEDPRFPGRPHMGARAQANGTAVYTADLNPPPGGLYAAVVPAPRLGTVTGISVPEGVNFVGAEHVPGLNHLPGFRPNDGDDIFVPVGGPVGYVGQAVGCVMARGELEARALAAMVRVEVDVDDIGDDEDVTSDSGDARENGKVMNAKESAADLDPGGTTPKNAARRQHHQRWLDSERVMTARGDGGRLESDGWRVIEHGDVDAVFAAAGGDAVQVVEGTVDLSHGQYPFYLETHCALVVPDGLGGYVVNSSTQAPSNVVDCVSRALGVADSHVTAVAARVGGGFGGKQLRAGPVAAMAAVCAHVARAPVKLQLSRGEDMRYCPGRTPVVAKYKAAFTKAAKATKANNDTGLGGKPGDVPTILALAVDVEGEAGVSQDYSLDVVETIMYVLDGGYRLPGDVRLRGRCRLSARGSYTATRGFGKPQAAAIIEEVLDHVAASAGSGLRAIDLRDAMLYKRGDQTPTCTEIGDDILRRCWDGTREAHAKALAEVEEFNRTHTDRKRGLAVVPAKGNMGFVDCPEVNAGYTKVDVLRDGSVTVTHSGVEMGQGLSTRAAAVAAHELGVPLDQVHVRETSTFVLPNTPPTTMVSTDVVAETTRMCCEQILARLPPGGTLAERVSTMGGRGYSGMSAIESVCMPHMWLDWKTSQGDLSYFWVWGAALSVVEVHLPTGGWSTIHTHVVQDCGRSSLNPPLDVGQVEGGFMFGLGYYMMEEMLYSGPRESTLFSDSASRYKIPMWKDTPRRFDVHVLEYGQGEQNAAAGAYGTKGIGEANIGLALSVYYAVKDALRRSQGGEKGQSGEEATQTENAHVEIGFPATPDRVRNALDRINGIDEDR